MIALACVLAGCAEERIRNDSAQLMSGGSYEQGVQLLEQGVQQHPDSVLLRQRLLMARSDALSALIEQANTARTSGKLDVAEQLLQRAAAFDSSGQRVHALQADLAIERRQTQALAKAQELVAAQQTDAALKLVNEALKDNRRHPGLLDLQRRLAVELRQGQVRAAQRGLAETRPITLDFRDANLRAVLDAVGRNSNLNFVIDKDVRADAKVTVYAKSVRLEDALDMILSSNQLAHKVMDDRTVLIYANTPEKQREYQEQVVRVFYLSNGDPKGAAAFLKAMVKIREPYVDERNNLLSLRDSLENIQLAERLITLFDHPEAEVLIDAQVLEVSGTQASELGLSLPDQITITPTSATGSTTFSLSEFPLHRSNIGITIPAATLNLKDQLGKVNTLANPRIRTRSHEKAKIMIGDKIPTITTTTSGTASYVSESVTYQDVGIKLEVEPTVYPDDDVGIKLDLEVSALGTEVQTSSGSIAYQISTRDASTLLRLHDGETQLLGGLISSDERTSASRLPGLGDLPVLGRLFSDQSDTNDRTELVLAITPHIVRAQPHLDAAEAEAWIGTEANQRLKPAGGRFDLAASPSSGNAGPQANPSAMGSAVPVPGAPTPAVPTTQERVPAGSAATISLTTPAEVHAGGLFEVDLQLRSGVPLGSLGLQVRYPTELLGLVGPVPTDLPEAQSGGDLSVHADAEGATVVEVPRVVANAPESALSLVRLQFKALKEGTGTVSLQLRPGEGAQKVTLPVAAPIKVLP